MTDERKHTRSDVRNVSGGILHPHNCSHVRMNFAVKQVNAGHIERRGKRSILRRILIKDDTGPGRFHQEGNRMTRTRAAVVDFEINSLTGSDGSERGPRDLTSEPVPGSSVRLMVSTAPPSACTVLGVTAVSASRVNVVKVNNAEWGLFIVLWFVVDQLGGASDRVYKQKVAQL